MKVYLVPLDERPCNALFPQMIVEGNDSITVNVVPKTLLGVKKKPALAEEISAYLLENSHQADALVLSIDMLVYGGLIPSRLHHLTLNEAMKRLAVIKELKKQNPKLKVYAFNCIMRAPSYDSSEEEPDYYEEYGYALFRRAYLTDLKKRNGLTDDEQEELRAITIPVDIIHDYEQRRDFNTDINCQVIDYVKEGWIDFLVFPQDDSSPYGYTALSQKKVQTRVKEQQLFDSIMIYPGADEVSMSLIARAYNEFNQTSPIIYPFYSSVLGPTIVPKYEDRPMFESLKSHIRVCGARYSESANDADIILAINAPGKVMQESFVDKNDLDLSYMTYRNLQDFVLRIKEFIDVGKNVALCDSAFSNGGDVELVSLLDQKDLLDKLIAYAGWNTNCNTLGTVLSQSLIGANAKHTVYRLIEDAFYQTLVRREVVETVLPEMGLSYYDFKDKEEELRIIVADKLLSHYQTLNIAKIMPVQKLSVSFPWQRMFEIGMEVDYKK